MISSQRGLGEGCGGRGFEKQGADGYALEENVSCLQKKIECSEKKVGNSCCRI